MPAKWFTVVDNKYVIADVLSGKVTIDEYPLPYLVAAGKIREWDGHLHVTDLYNGERETFLKYNTFYSIDPDKQAFAIAGTFKHNIMEDPTNPFHEKAILYRNIKGSLDLLNDKGNGVYWLDDYKNQGAFAVRKFKGWQKRPVQIMDDFGVPLFLKSGPNKGKPKTKLEWYLDPATADRSQYEFQLNIYKKAVEESLDITVSKLNIFFMLRDGGLKATTDQGLNKNTYYEEVKILDDDTINRYIDSKSGTAQKIIDFQATEGEAQDERWESLKKLCPPLCSEKERWYDPATKISKKCKDYCPVSELCGRIN